MAAPPSAPNYPYPPPPALWSAAPAGGHEVQDIGQSLLANVGSPRGHFYPPGHADMDGEVAVHRSVLSLIHI